VGVPAGTGGKLAVCGPGNSHVTGHVFPGFRPLQVAVIRSGGPHQHAVRVSGGLNRLAVHVFRPGASHRRCRPPGLCHQGDPEACRSGGRAHGGPVFGIAGAAVRRRDGPGPQPADGAGNPRTS